MRRENLAFFPLLALALSLCLSSYVDAASSLQPPVKLMRHYYKRHNTCDEAEVYVRHEVEKFWKEDKSITPKLLRLVYSDCMVNVCAS